MGRLLLFALSPVLALVLSAQTLSANQINTGGPDGAYHSFFCPSLVGQLNEIGLDRKCVTSAGTGENMRRVARDPSQIGFGQLDVFALESSRYGGAEAFEVIRSDDVRECVFAVTKNREIRNFGMLAVYADRTRFVLPPKGSGSAKTFEFLQKIDPEGLGQAPRESILHASTTEEAIRLALANDESVTFFVQFPNPESKRFELIRQLGGHILPVIDSVILRQKVGERTVYYAQQTSIPQSKWLLNLGKKVVTVCTPLVMFTGVSDSIALPEQRREHRSLVLNIRGMKREQLVPETSRIAQILKKTRQLSTRARLHFQELSIDARERARPFFERMYRGAQHIVRLMILKARPPEHQQ